MTEVGSNGGVPLTNFRSSFDWGQSWIPHITAIVGPRLLRVSTLKEDTTEATDLIVLKADGIRLACRVRGKERDYSVQYGWDVTMTCRRETGSLCEWHKMILGDWGDWFFYGHASIDQFGHRAIFPWHLIDLRRVRTILRQRPWPELGPNRDLTGFRCWFHAFDVRREIRQAVLASSLPIDQNRVPAGRRVQGPPVEVQGDPLPF